MQQEPTTTSEPQPSRRTDSSSTNSPTVNKTAANQAASTPTAEIETLWEVSHDQQVRRSHLPLSDGIIVCSPGGIFKRVSYHGVVQWSQPIGGVETFTNPALSGTTVVSGNGSAVVGLDTDTGDVAWETAIPAQVPTDAADTYLVATEGVALCGYNYQLDDGTNRAGLFGIDIATGDIAWSKVHDDVTAAYDSWLGIQSLSPVVDGQTVVGGWNHSFWLDIVTGTFVEDAAADARYEFIRRGARLYATNFGVLHTWNIANGGLSKVWEFDPLGRASTAPAIRDGTVYFVADDPALYAVRDGEQVWRTLIKKGFTQRPAATESSVWVAVEGQLYRFDAETGSPVSTALGFWQHELTGAGDRVLASGDETTAAYRIAE